MANRKHATKKRRHAAAVAELAVCLPAVILLVMGALECCSMVFLKQSLHVAAYEAVRVAIRNDSDTTEVTDRCARVLNERSIVSPHITITPRPVEAIARGTPIQVRVTAPCAPNSPLRLQFFTSNMEATATMIKE